jgi:VCBS repeat-containing protein
MGNGGIGTTITATTGDQFGVSASSVLLGSLQNNGGPTSTHALGAGSIAIDKGDSSGSTTDQRGLPRPCDDSGIANATGGDGADIGAFEVQGCAANHAPVAHDDNATVNEDSTNNIIDVLANDTDSDGDTLTITGVTQGTNGSVTNNATDVSYTPAPLFFGSDAFTYTISDGHGGNATATVHVTVNHVNHPPHANADSYAVNQDTVLSVAAPGVLGNDTDVDAGDTLHAVLVSSTSHGSLTLNADGSFTYTPNPGFACSDSFTYKANDGTADSNVATVSITVNDTQGPAISVSTSTTMIWPPNHDLVNVGLAFSATDNGCSGAATTSVAIFSDEDDVTSADGDESPDAKGMLFLRAERDARSDGRVYLIRVTSTDASSNTSHKCAAVVVPHSLSAADVASVNAQAASAVSQCTANGFFVVGDGPVIGPKQ